MCLGLLKHLQVSWESKELLEAAEQYLFHLTKVKRFKSKYRSIKGRETHKLLSKQLSEKISEGETESSLAPAHS